MGEKKPEILTYAECTALLAPVAAVLGFDASATTFKAYHHALRDVPAQLLKIACERATKEPRAPFDPRFPTAPQLRAWCEAARVAWIKANPWEPCEACAENPGWIGFLDAVGVQRLSRCTCVKAYRDRMASSGMAVQLALPVAPTPVRDEADA